MYEINKILQQLGMSFKEFSEHYKIPYNTVRQWAQGTRKPPTYVIRLLNEKIERDSKGEQIEIQYDEISEYQQGEDAMALFYDDIIIPQKIKEIINKFTEKIEWAIVDNTYPYFDKDGKPVNIWKAHKGFLKIEEIAKEILNDY